jgi:prefoldin subunit 2
MASTSAVATAAAKKQDQEAIIAQFNKLRQEQRSLATKLSELQMDLNEHK